MGKPGWLASFILWTALTAIPASAETPAAETWTPTSRNAQTVTGKVVVAAGQITFQNGTSMQISRPSQMLFRPKAKARKVMADLYRLTAAADQVLENGSKLCGSRTATYMIVWKSEKLGPADIDPRTMAVFSGPRFDPGSPDECARYVYDAGR